MIDSSIKDLASQWREWQLAYLKITALLGFTLLIIGIIAMLFVRGSIWRPNDLPDVLFLAGGSFLGFYALAFLVSSLYYSVRAAKAILGD